MLVLDLPPQTEQKIIQIAHYQGVTVNELIQQWADIQTNRPAKKSVADLVKGKFLQGFDGDPVNIQRALRDE